MLTKNPGEVFEAVYESAVSGLAGTVAVAIHDNQSTVVYGPTVLQIVELIVDGQGTGTYRAMLVAPADEGQYTISWSNDGSFDPEAGGAVEDLEVAETALALPSLGGEIGAVLCNAWTTAESMVVCCDAEFDSSGELADSSIVAASELLYLASGKQYPGICAMTVRPCKTDGCSCGYQVLSRGHLVGWDGDCWSGYECGCSALSRVRLAGHVQEITSVKIDGVVVDPDTYFVYRNTWLTRKDGLKWPRCQSLDRDDTDEGTFSVSYSYGKAPPVIGQLAAAQLACEIVKSCTPDLECALPNGVTRITRQGITIERNALLRDPKTKIWRTGMDQVDFFLNAVNPHGLARRAIGWSAGSRSRYPMPEPE